MHQIRTVVIPAAGLGTRFLPLTKVVPKELIPIMDKPALHYIVAQAAAAGIKNCCLIINRNKHAIRDYFLTTPHLDAQLACVGKTKLMQPINELIQTMQFTFVEQDEPRGLGHAILQAREKVCEDFFAVMLPDDIIAQDDDLLGSMVALAQQYQAAVVGVIRVSQKHISAYGVVSIDAQVNERVYAVNAVVEKPTADKAPSDFAIIGRYVLPRAIFDVLAHTPVDAGNEIQLTDAIGQLIAQKIPVIAYHIEGHRFDLGTPLGWLEANIFYARHDERYASSINQFLSNL